MQDMMFCLATQISHFSVNFAIFNMESLFWGLLGIIQLLRCLMLLTSIWDEIIIKPKIEKWM